jgi:glycosyltransferase involved in cell wall biosynthesis
VRAFGVVPKARDAWAQLDVAINPVRWGSGLKIKTVEAFATGVPLVTTTEGARGVSAQAGSSFLLADDPGLFAQHVLDLINSAALRRSVADAGFAWASKTLSPDACFGPLWEELCRLSGSSSAEPGSLS